MKQFKALVQRHKSPRVSSSPSKAAPQQRPAAPSSTAPQSLPQQTTPASANMSSAALSGKVAVITGGTKGIGAATATQLVSLGAKVVVNYGRATAAANA